MVRVNKTKNLRGQWSDEDAGDAVAAVEGTLQYNSRLLKISKLTRAATAIKGYNIQ